MTVARRQCPRCGNLIDQPRLAEDDRDAVITSLRQEIRRLQETIAYLRGSLGSRAGRDG
jgi:transcription initiation factor IIE alpha subunit